MAPSLSVILPCYNESGNIPDLLNRFRSLTREMDLELVLVNNGSTDDSADVFECELKRPENQFARVVLVPINQGYGYGLRQGLQTAKADVVAFTHADLQCPPESLATAWQWYQKHNPSLIKGRRKGSRPWPDQIVTWLYNRFTKWLLGINATCLTTNEAGRTPDVNAQPKLFPRILLEDLPQSPNDFTFDLFILEACRRRALPVYEFDTLYEARLWGKSKLAANVPQRVRTAAVAFWRIVEYRWKK
jgi:glycosyltransferase involved in cell wall biosynthesis